MRVKNKIKKYFEDLPNNKKTRLKQLSIGLVVVAIFYIGISQQQTDKQQQNSKHNARQTQEVEITQGELFEESVIDEVDEKLGEKDIQIESLRKQVADMSQLVQAVVEQQSQQPQLSDATGTIATNYPSTPTNANKKYQNNYSNNYPTQEQDLQMQPQWVGSIVHEPIRVDESINTTDATLAAQKKTIVKLPPGFMNGFLLTGMDAMTIEGSSDSPEPMMIRVQAPAVLPNSVKANLDGCFVIAEGYGNLATHRVDARLKSLNCINYKNRTFISENIKGYVQDMDGKRGIKGQVVHRAGALIARSMIAGAFEGIGNATTAASQITSVSAFGQTNTTNSNEMTKSALGGAISSGAKDIRGLFLQLARQSSPVIEVGSAKQISVVITQLVHLKIQEL